MKRPKEFLFESVARRLGEGPHPAGSAAASGAGRNYHCVCGRPVFFRNSKCLGCNTPLGYEPHHSWLLPLTPGGAPNTWQAIGETGAQAPVYRRCANFDSAAGCNWLLDAPAPGHVGPVQTFCVACRLNRTIPDQRIAQNHEWWRRIEVAKRRLVSGLLLLGLPVQSRVSEDRQRGLMFDLLSPTPAVPHVLTGHEDGLITINVEEADDAKRERVRAAMSEPYRTLLGHFRHEVGHYYWDRLVERTHWLVDFRWLFGNEQLDYQAALKRNYETGPPANWDLNHVSSYASSHPWEDWAETWAHYLHMMDTMDTALGFGIDAEDAEQYYEPFSTASLYRPDDEGAQDFLAFVNAWVRVTGMMNELARSMGQPDLYPFVLPTAVVRKLHFVHMVVSQARLEAQPLEPTPVPDAADRAHVDAVSPPRTPEVAAQSTQAASEE